MISPRENLLRLYRRQGMAWPMLHLSLCASQWEHFRSMAGPGVELAEYYDCADRLATTGLPMQDVLLQDVQGDAWRARYPFALKDACTFDRWGVAHESGSAAAHHMTRMRHPLAHIESVAALDEHPFPRINSAVLPGWQALVAAEHQAGRAVIANMECTVWETAWYLRGMPELMADMMDDDELAVALFDRVTGLAIERARLAAQAGVDIIALGDDIGMQERIMMSLDCWRAWIKPRLAAVISAARAERPEVLIQYHSCGYVEPFIEDLIAVGVDILNPVQPECMDPVTIHEHYGDRLSFNGMLGTQTVLPFGTPAEVASTTRRYLEMLGDRGGALVCPTHLVEPEVPWANIEAYITTVRDFR